jgi:hypothetical protein
MTPEEKLKAYRAFGAMVMEDRCRAASAIEARRTKCEGDPLLHLEPKHDRRAA